LQIVWNGSDWLTSGDSAVVWAFHQPLPDGHGGVCEDIRAISWNGLVRLRSGRLVMPIGGRSSESDPQGRFSKLDRVWMLASTDDGATWTEAYFVAGKSDLCFAEPTLVETGKA